MANPGTTTSPAAPATPPAKAGKPSARLDTRGGYCFNNVGRVGGDLVGRHPTPLMFPETPILSYTIGDEPPASDVVVAPDASYLFAIHNGPAVSVIMQGYGRAKNARLISGSITLIPAGTRSIWSWNQPCRSICLSLPATVVAESFEEWNIREPAGLKPFVAFDDPVIREVGFRLSRGIIDPLDHLYQESATRFLAFHLVGVMRNEPQSLHDVRSARMGRLSEAHVLRLREFLEENLSLNLNLETLARQVHLSPSRFSHSFKAATGESPHRYVMRLRCERAVELIRGRNELSDVAAQCGFSDQSHMGRCVRKFTGRTPAALRLSFS